jgi:hypothetical protein
VQETEAVAGDGAQSGGGEPPAAGGGPPRRRLRVALRLSEAHAAVSVREKVLRWSGRFVYVCDGLAYELGTALGVEAARVHTNSNSSARLLR